MPPCPGQGVPPSQGPRLGHVALGRGQRGGGRRPGPAAMSNSSRQQQAAVEAEGEVFCCFFFSFFFFFLQQNQKERERERERGTVGRKKVLEPSLGGLTPGPELGSWGWGGVGEREAHLAPASPRFAAKGRPPRRAADAASEAAPRWLQPRLPPAALQASLPQTFAEAVPSILLQAPPPGHRAFRPGSTDRVNRSQGGT